MRPSSRRASGTVAIAPASALLLGFHPVPILLGFVLGPRLEENFRRALFGSYGDPNVFIEWRISAVFLGLSVLLIGGSVSSGGGAGAVGPA